MNFDKIPQELRELDRWVCWRLEERKGKPTKVPVNPKPKRDRTYGNARSDIPDTWSSYTAALECFGKDSSLAGIGFMLGDNYVGVDIDECQEDGRLAEHARDIVSTLDSFTEYSPSGNGLHIICRGKLPEGRRQVFIERDGKPNAHLGIYDERRFFCMTGNILDVGHMDVEERTAELVLVHDKYINVKKPAKSVNEPAKNVNNSVIYVSDDELIEAALNAKNGDMFAGLMDGNWKGRYPSSSEADLALCNLLAFWTGNDRVAMDRLFRRSGLYRDKWGERRGEAGTYGGITIQKAIADCGETYSPPAASRPKQAEPLEIDTGLDELVKDADKKGLPRIIISGRDMGELSDQVLKSLIDFNEPPVVFVRASGLVRINQSKDKDEKTRPIIKAFSEAALRGRMARTAHYFRVSKDTEKNGIEYSATNPPLDIVRDIMSIPEESWTFPYLAGITQIPILRKDGTIFNEIGYDKESSLYYLPESKINIYLDIKTAEAVDLLQEIYCDFPFDGEASRANCIGLLFTLVLREFIDGSIPLAIVDKPQQGTGASLLADVNSLVSTGQKAFMQAWPTGKDRESELRKRITAILVEGRSQVVIDNVENTLQSAVLGLLLTCTSWEDRALGENKLIRLPHRTVWTATGNNVQPAGDIPRRCYTIKIDAKRPRPWQRTGFKHPNLLEWVGENRSRILSAIFKLAQNWIYAGKPLPSDLPTIGSFEEWTRTIGGILHFAGIDGFLSNIETTYEKSEENDGWEAFLEAWYAELGDKALTLKEVSKILLEKENFSGVLPENFDVNDKGFTRQLGHAIKRREGVVFPNNYHIERAGEEQRAIKWKVSLVTSVSSVSTATYERMKQENMFTYKGVESNSLNSQNSHEDWVKKAEAL